MSNSKYLFKGFIDQNQASEIIDVPVDMIIKLINDNQIPARQIGDKYYFKTSALVAVIKKPNVGIPNKEVEVTK